MNTCGECRFFVPAADPGIEPKRDDYGLCHGGPPTPNAVQISNPQDHLPNGHRIVHSRPVVLSGDPACSLFRTPDPVAPPAPPTRKPGATRAGTD